MSSTGPGQPARDQSQVADISRYPQGSGQAGGDENVDDDEHEATPAAGPVDQAKKRPLSGSASPSDRLSQRARTGTRPAQARDSSRPPAPEPIPARPRQPVAQRVQQPAAATGRAVRTVNEGAPALGRSGPGGASGLNAARVRGVEVPAPNVKPDPDGPTAALPRPRAHRSPPLEPYVAPASPVRPQAAPPARAQPVPAQARPPVAPNQGPPPGTHGNRNGVPAASQSVRAPSPQVNAPGPANHLPGHAQPRQGAPQPHAQVAPAPAHVAHAHAAQHAALRQPAPAPGVAGPNPAAHAHQPAQDAGPAVVPAPAGAAQAQVQPNAQWEVVLVCAFPGCVCTFPHNQRTAAQLHVMTAHCPPAAAALADRFIVERPRVGLVCAYEHCCCRPSWPTGTGRPHARTHVLWKHLNHRLADIGDTYLLQQLKRRA